MTALDPMQLPLSGPHLIEASAGTGKTYTIATLVLRLIIEQGLDIDRILVVTFTEAAAAELRDRIRTRLRTAIAAYQGAPFEDDAVRRLVELRRADGHAKADATRLEAAVRSFDEAAISTIHGFCHRVLHDSAFETGVGFETELVTNQQPLLDLVARDFWARELYGADPLFVGHLLQNNVTPARLVRLAAVASAHLDAPVLPSSVDLGAHPEVAPFVAAFERARERWHEDSAHVQALLLQHEGLYANIYPKNDLPGWFQAIDAFFRPAAPMTLSSVPQLDKLCPEMLERKTKKEWVRRGEVPRHPFFDACGELVRAWAPLRGNFELRHVDLKRRLIDFVRKELPRRKRIAGVQSFDDLLHGLDRALRRRPGGKQLGAVIRGRYQAALIDEFQDTDPVQYRIFHAIYGGTELPLFLIGDPKQAIYGFRGADVFAYLDAADSVGKRKLTMDTNWRADPELVRATEHLFDVPRPFWLESIEFPRVKAKPGAEASLRVGGEPLPAFEIAFARNEIVNARDCERKVGAHVAANISVLLQSGAMLGKVDGERPVHAGDIAVLVRRNAQAQQIQAELRKLGIPGVVYGDASVFETREAEELLRVLSAVAEPTHDGLLRAAVTTELLGVTGSELDAMRDDDQAWNAWVQLFRRWHATWAERGFIQMFRAVLHDSKAGARLLRLLDGERRMTNLLHLAELLHNATTTEHLGPAGLLRWFSEEKRRDQAMADAAKLRLERDDRAVQLVTIHRAKGLEYPIVYCPYSWVPDEPRSDEEENLLFHDPLDGNRLKLDISLKPADKHGRARLPHVQQARFETEAEGLRLLYVAVTRARHRCVMVWGNFSRVHRSALGYLLHASCIPEGAAWDPKTVADHIKSCDDETLLAWLHQRAADHWSVSMLDAHPPRMLPPAAAPAAPLLSRTPRERIDRWYRTSSFTQLTAPSQKLTGASEGRDHDAWAPAVEPARVPPDSHAPPVTLAEFPRGAKVGNFFHETLEGLDFATDTAALRERVQSKLRAFGMADAGLIDPATTALTEILDTPLMPSVPGLRLRSIATADRRDELPFLVPVGPTDADGALGPRGLAKVFADHPQGLPEHYAQHVAQLGFVPLRGFLKGFIDVVFRFDGRWYLVDYKTNHLGTTPSCYGPAALAEAMAEHHYVLQYHLYTLAWVRHLQHALPGFDYARDFGGVLYLFLRGMSPEHPGSGIYSECPPPGRLDALSDLFTLRAGASATETT